jgi:putative DNA primase/helicase
MENKLPKLNLIRVPTTKQQDPTGDENGPPEHSDQDLTLQFVKKNHHRLRHCNELGGWLYYENGRWLIDKINRASELVSQFCRSVSAELIPDIQRDSSLKKTAHDIASRRTVSAILKLAQSHKLIARTANQFDQHKHLLNTPGGTIDLDTGLTLPHNPEDQITRITKGKPDGQAPQFLRFLDEITLGDIDLQNYLQRLAGYWLTGHTHHQQVHFIIGPGENGKSKFMDSIKETMGDYAQVTALDLFAKKPPGGHSTDFADLMGLRLMYSSETDGDEQLSADKLKALSGGESIKARKMRSDNIEFRPEGKFVLVGNHEPRFVRIDNGLRRRILIIPFNFVPKEKDLFLEAKLFRELDGILDWALKGARLNAKERGLGAKPEVVKQATSRYFSKSDSIAQWLHEYCYPNPGAKTFKTRLWDSYLGACVAIGAAPEDRKQFFKILSNKYGFVDVRESGGGRSLIGVSFRVAPTPSNEPTPVSDDPTDDKA